jgi:serine protease Do
MKPTLSNTLLFIAICGGGCLLAPTASNAGKSDPTAIEAPVPIENAGTYNPARSFAPLIQAIEPAVIAIEVENTVQQSGFRGGFPPGFEEFFGGRFAPPPGPQTVRGEGSGFIVSGSGLVMTNNHVVAEAESIRARFTDGRTVPLTLVGRDARTDVALLQLPSDQHWPHVPLAKAHSLEVGDWVIAVGNPLGLGSTVTAGIISGKGRDLANGNAYDQFLQTDAAINQGNSGGPLFNLDGQVVGMNTAIIQGANTIGFAIPVHILKRVQQDLQRQGYVSRGFIGVSAQPMDAQLAEALGAGTEKGALVAKVYAGAPAEGAGLKQGDVIVQIDGETIAKPADLVRAVGEHHPGETVSMVFIRQGKRLTVEMKLAELPDTEKSLMQRETENTRKKSGVLTEVGLDLVPLSAQLAAKAGVRQGVLIQGVARDSKVDGRLQAGDVLVQVNNRSVNAPNDVSNILRASRGVVSFLVIRGDRQMYIAVSLR